MPLPREMTKGQRRRLRELASIAHERELGSALGGLEQQFARWRRGEIAAFDLSDELHRFHDGASRRLFVHYQGDADFTVADAVRRGVLRADEVDATTLQLLGLAP